MAQFVAALNYHYSSHKRVELFCHQMGLDDTAEMPELDLRDTTFLIEVLRRLKKRGELKPEPAPKGVTTSLVFRNTVSRSAVMAATCVATRLATVDCAAHTCTFCAGATVRTTDARRAAIASVVRSQ